MKKRAILGALVIGILFYEWQSQPTKVKEPTAAPEAALNQIQSEPVKRVLASLKANDGVKKPTTVVKVKPKPAPLPFQAELSDFENLNDKVLLTHEEVQERQALLSNAQVLKGLAKRLTTPAVDLQAKEDQDAILDMELAALKKGNREAARAALAMVAADQQIEDAKLPEPARKNLAGVKAEMLFEWSAEDPESAQKISSLLPGPVSQRIWHNVGILQNQDLAASAAVH